MTGSVVGIIVGVALTAALGRLFSRAHASSHPMARWPLALAVGMATIASLVVTSLAAIGTYRVFTPRGPAVDDVIVAGTPEQVTRGRQLARAVCAVCHSTSHDVPLSGGGNLSDELGLPLGSIYAPNLTPSGEIATWTDGEIIRATRNGVHKDGRQLAMPTDGLRHLSDEDIQALVAYLRSQPGVSNTVPDFEPSPLEAILAGAGSLDFSGQPVDKHVAAPTPGQTPEYGDYLVTISNCRGCHGADLRGKTGGARQVGPSLAPVVNWTTDQFVAAMRTGEKPDGSSMSDLMPWRENGHFGDGELAAILDYIAQEVK